MGYYKNPKATAETFDAEGWLHTGDRFKVDEVGRYLYVLCPSRSITATLTSSSYVDRAKDTLKVSGTQVSPLEIEDTLLAHPGKLTSDVAVAGVPGTRMSDEKVPRAWAVLSERGRRMGRKQVTHELEALVKERLSRPKWLRGGIGFVEEVSMSKVTQASFRLTMFRFQSCRRAKCLDASFKRITRPLSPPKAARRPKRSFECWTLGRLTGAIAEQ